MRITNGLLVIVAAGIWSLFVIEIYQKQMDSAHSIAMKAQAVDLRKIEAWRCAVRYRNFYPKLQTAEQEPANSKTFTERHIWVKAYQRQDVSEVPAKFGNDSYRVRAVVVFNDRLPLHVWMRVVGQHLSEDQFHYISQGEWHPVSMECVADELDDGTWMSRDYKFIAGSTKPDFPLVEIVRDSGP